MEWTVQLVLKASGVSGASLGCAINSGMQRPKPRKVATVQYRVALRPEALTS